jgi:hypothetical protein
MVSLKIESLALNFEDVRCGLLDVETVEVMIAW